MMKSPNWLVLATSLVVLALGAYPGQLQAQPVDTVDWKARFLNEAPKGWARYYARASRMHGSVKAKGTTFAPKNKVYLEINGRFKQAPGCAIVENQWVSQSGKAQSKGTLAAVNSKYRFNLKRSTPSSPWVLVDVSNKLITEPPPLQPALSTTYYVKGIIATPIAINHNPKDDWPTLLSTADFKLLSVTAEAEAGRNLVRVEFDRPRAASKENIISVKSGRVWFDPEHCWVMRKCDYKLEMFGDPTPTTRDESVSFEYEYQSDGFPVLKRIVSPTFNSKGELTSEHVEEFHLVLEDVPESEFTLSAFGFPEPSFATPIRWYLWIIAGAVVIGGFAFWYRRKVQPS